MVGSLRSLLICHKGATLDERGLAAWLASFSDLAGVLVLDETAPQVRRRIQRELKRVGPLRLLDVLAFRLFYRLFHARRDTDWESRTLARLAERYPTPPDGIPTVTTHSVNSDAAREFVSDCAPDVMIARCKQIIGPEVFTIPTHGTWVMHPGVCPEYRNAHGCFWALANDDLDHVGLTLLQIDEGVDTGPVYGYFDYDFDEVDETHIVIQARVLLDNLDGLRDRLLAAIEGGAEPIDTTGRQSGVWGQPWLSRHLRWKRRARRRAGSVARGSDARPESRPGVAP